MHSNITDDVPDDRSHAAQNGTPRWQTARLAEFVAWLAGRVSDEPSRRTARQAAESYLTWCADDAGPADTRRARFLAGTGKRTAHGLPAQRIRDGLALLDEHRFVLAHSLPAR